MTGWCLEDRSKDEWGRREQGEWQPVQGQIEKLDSFTAKSSVAEALVKVKYSFTFQTPAFIFVGHSKILHFCAETFQNRLEHKDELFWKI